MTTAGRPTRAPASGSDRIFGRSESYSSRDLAVLKLREVVRKPSSLFSSNSVKLPKVTAKINTGFCIKSSMSINKEQGLVRGENTSTLGEKDAVVIVDHGSRRKESNLMLNEFVAMFKGRTGYQIVEPAHMELAEPSIRDAFKQCVQQGANRIIVSPFFLFPGRHWHQDIPSLAAEAAKEHSGISYIVTAPLGLHELMVRCSPAILSHILILLSKQINFHIYKLDVMNDRIKQCLSHVAGDADECTICAGTGRCREYRPS